MGVSVPALLPGYHIPKRYTCDGADVSLPVQWSAVPHGTVELALFIINFQPVHGHFFFDWAVTGLKPTSQGISAGSLPSGAVVGRNSFGKVGYSICPVKGRRRPTSYAVKVLALPYRLPAEPGFEANRLYLEVERLTRKGVGFAAGEYQRRRR
jgi:hypothetical protein